MLVLPVAPQPQRRGLLGFGSCGYVCPGDLDKFTLQVMQGGGTDFKIIVQTLTEVINPHLINLPSAGP